MCLLGAAVYQNIIKEDKDKLPQVGLENMVHEILEGRGSIGEAKWHYQVLKMAKMGFKSCFRYVRRVNPDLVIARFEVNFGEEFGSL